MQKAELRVTENFQDFFGAEIHKEQHQVIPRFNAILARAYKSSIPLKFNTFPIDVRSAGFEKSRLPAK